LNGNIRNIDVYCSFLPEWPNSHFLAIRSIKPFQNSEPLSQYEMDQETGLANTKAFEEHANVLLCEDREGAPVEMSFLTLDALDKENEEFDESINEEVLEAVSGILRTQAGDERSAARISDSKFGIIHDKNFKSTDLKKLLSEKLPSNVPFGMQSLFMDQEDMSAVDISKALVYTINRFATDDAFSFSTLGESYNDMVADTKLKLKKFKDVISNSSFDLVLQPIVDINSCEVHHYEVLSRLHDGSSSPFEFITFAEQVGVIGDFDMAVLERSIDRVTKMLDQGASNISLAVNISGRSLFSYDFMKLFMERLEGLEDMRANMMFEVTESSQISDLGAANKTIQIIRNMGHKVCLDDFGAGSSGFQYLRQLEVDYIKIDGSYIKDSLENPNSKALLKSVAELCQQLNIKTIGEWVETEEQRRFLKEIGVNLGQGHLFGKPIAGTTGRYAYAGLRGQTLSS
ncbi:MAG: GGDEF domain-containing protein, partial [Sphingomonadales bacterium]|nr:GGDEF domain-containing protein [Sphingomonadales bacterium]